MACQSQNGRSASEQNKKNEGSGTCLIPPFKTVSKFKHVFSLRQVPKYRQNSLVCCPLQRQKHRPTQRLLHVSRNHFSLTLCVCVFRVHAFFFPRHLEFCDSTKETQHPQSTNNLPSEHSPHLWAKTHVKTPQHNHPKELQRHVLLKGSTYW